MRLYRTRETLLLEHDREHFDLGAQDWDELLNREGLGEWLRSAARCAALAGAPTDDQLLPPVRLQEVWAAGVTYFRSRTARMEESKTAGGGSFYDRVYDAERPELFLKATGWRAVGPGSPIRIRRDSRWNVPEPELALVVNRRAEIVGYTIGNDVSSRDIEGENPLYLPQAKFYDGACALGPGVLIAEGPLAGETAVEIVIERSGEPVYEGTTTLSQMRRTPDELVEYLFRETSFPQGVVLLTGTGLIPPDEFTLASGDRVRITIASIGELVNVVE